MRIVTIESLLALDILGAGVTMQRWGRVIVAKQGVAVSNFDIAPIRLNPDWETYQTGYANFEAQFGTGVIFGPPPPLQLFEAKIWESMMPAKAYERKVAATVRVRGSDKPNETQVTAAPGLSLIMVHPTFDLPVYEYLVEQSKSYMFALLDDMPANTVGVFEVNRAAIESFLAGMNTEMARELLWREYPTDQRGSYFRRFWDPASPTQGPVPDVKLMHEWTSDLGGNHQGAKASLALVVRGELLKKYPQTLVYAHKAQYDGGDRSKPRLLTPDAPGNMVFPVFSAFIEPDIMLLGFNLTEKEVIGNRKSGGGAGAVPNPGYFFVFRERPGQLQFGMDEAETKEILTSVANWNDLSWQHFQSPEDTHAFHLPIALPPTLKTVPSGQPRWGSNAAEMAAILLQKPVLMARHAQELLVVDHSDLQF